MQWYKHKITPLNKKVETWETNWKCVWTSQCKICLGKRHYHQVDRSENANYYCVYTATRNRARIVLCWKLHNTGHTGGASFGTPCICYSTKTQREPPRRHCYITTILSLHHFLEVPIKIWHCLALFTALSSLFEAIVACTQFSIHMYMYS